MVAVVVVVVVVVGFQPALAPESMATVEQLEPLDVNRWIFE